MSHFQTQNLDQDISIFQNPYEYFSFPILLFVNSFNAFQCLELF